MNCNIKPSHQGLRKYNIFILGIIQSILNIVSHMQDNPQKSFH